MKRGMAMIMDERKRRKLRRERLRREREKLREKLIGLIWGSMTILVVFAVLFIGFGASEHEAMAATNVVSDATSGRSPENDKSVDSSSRYPLGFVEPIGSLEAAVPSGKGCKADMSWPVVPHVLIRKFKAPKQAWGPGHRGVDIAAIEDTPLLAPANGFISFAGIVAGKSVVSIRHKSLTLTLEPAQTLLPIGTPVVKGLPIGVVKGISDHCTGICVHWGVRKTKKEYRDPQLLAAKRKIILKPVL
ncbi:M23 family metallopeptidase [Bifidobacterium sp. ESL0800]|uniref:M23 family metallopeptidase n=1 Tax=Bifidobacterium sp. ESL0800 TaxID=2983236 RepID=UPI0023F6DE76|nr:M23 family metallopeptidase [Bifidobacterium sp. ESL0800]WEV76199.1 M23 family metallopeptidase [Bifidobacterium sp. ESL0800]